jgi:hypothetical protein
MTPRASFGFIGIIILGILLLAIVLLIVGIIVALLATRKEKKEQVRVTVEAQKIDSMAAAGRITTEEARELKQALGPIAFTQTSREPDVHIKIIGILNIVFGILGIFAGIGFPVLLGLMHFRVQNTGGGVTFWAVIALLPLLIFLAISILRIAGGSYLMKGTPWARIVIIIFAILSILSFPIGTALGIYTLWALLFREDAGLYFISKDNAV